MGRQQVRIQVVQEQTSGREDCKQVDEKQSIKIQRTEERKKMFQWVYRERKDEI